MYEYMTLTYSDNFHKMDVNFNDHAKRGWRVIAVSQVDPKYTRIVVVFERMKKV